MHPSFLTVMAVAELLDFLRTQPRLAPERVSLDAALGRILACDFMAPEDLPPADRASMDGYAVQGADTFGASDGSPALLDIAGEVLIGTNPSLILTSGQCAGIATGAFMPQGADAVVMVEHTAPFGPKQVEIRRPVSPGEHIMFRGDDVHKGSVAIAKGSALRPQELGLLAALGCTSLDVFCRPCVSILSTGDELVACGEHMPPGKIRDINSTSLAAQARKAGALVWQAGIAPDKAQVLLEQITMALLPPQSPDAPFQKAPDVLILSGGSSAGRHDLTSQVLEMVPGCRIICHGLALSPGKPTIIAQSPTTLILGLPGQAGAAQVVMQVIGMPLLRHLAGALDAFNQQHWPRVRAVLTRNTASKPGREDYIRVRLSNTATGLPLAEPLSGPSGLLRTLLDADGLVRIDAQAEGLLAQSPVDVLLW